MKQFFFSLIFLFLTCNGLHAQFTTADIAVNGLTCSQCSRSVEMSLKRLDFIEEVEMNLQEPTAHIIFKKNKKVDFAKMATAVKDAGFAVRHIKSTYNIEIPSSDACFVYNKQLYYPVSQAKLTQQKLQILLLGKGMISDGELKKMDQKNWVEKPSCSMTASKKIPFLALN